MTMLDDPSFLLFHTKLAFITSDETGACELVMENEDKIFGVDKQRPTNLKESELAHSPDIFPDMDYGGHRFRSNTAQRLEKLLIEKQNQSSIQRITWKIPDNYEHTNLTEIFEEKEVIPLSSRIPMKSMLSKKIIEFDKIQEGNCFGKYAKFDGRPLFGTNNNLVKMIDIFLTMASPSEREYTMNVVVVNNARIRDLIGLICWQYFIEKRKPELKQDVDQYELYMAEDNGEADKDFPPLDHREPITKFDFARLALVEKNPTSGSYESKSDHAFGAASLPSPNTSDLLEKFNIKSSISINIPGSGVVILNFEELGKNVKLVRDLLIEVVTKEKLDSKYHLERSDTPGVTIDNDLLVRRLTTNDLCLIKNSSSSFPVATYTILMLQKFMPSSEVYLVLSDKRIEIHLLKHSVPFSLKQMKQVVSIESLLGCQKLEEKASSTSSFGSSSSMFRITFKVLPGKTKQKTFVCETPIADEIVAQLNKSLLEKSHSVNT